MMFHPAATLRDGAHHYAVRIYYEDTDAGGVVYHANYLRFAERARTEALRDLGVPHAELATLHRTMFMVRRVKLDYLRPARLDDSLVVVTRAMRIGAASLELRQDFRRAGDTDALAVLEVGLACVSLEAPRAVRMPQRWRAALLEMSGGRPGSGANAPCGAQ